MYCFCTTVVAWTAHDISFCSALPSAIEVIIWYLVLLFIFVRAYLTFPKAIVLILKHTTSLHFSMLHEPALIQADLDYQKAGVDQKIQQYVAASQGHSVEWDRAFIIDIGIGSDGSSILCLFKSYNTFISNLRCDKCIRGIVGLDGFWNWHSDTVVSVWR